jgi:hypothetical protein
VVDYLWYRRKVKGAYTDSLGFDVIDEWGRMIPDPDRWPSSKGGKGFTEVAKKVHSVGLKFGIHVMRGISTQAVNANTPILDTISVLLWTPSIAHTSEIRRKKRGWVGLEDASFTIISFWKNQEAHIIWSLILKNINNVTRISNATSWESVKSEH